MLNPYDPQASMGDTTDPGVYNNVAAFLGNPGVQASLLSAGLQLMQPPEFGQNGLAHLASAVGAGGESAQLQNKQQLAQSEASSKQDLRSAQADAAASRAETAGARSDAAASRLGLEQQKLQAMNERNNLNNRVRVSVAYQNYVKDVGRRNLLAPAGQQEPILPIGDWIKANPALQGLLPEGGSGTTDDTSSPTSPTATPTSSAKPIPTVQDIAYLRANPGMRDRFIARFGQLPPGFQ